MTETHFHLFSYYLLCFFGDDQACFAWVVHLSETRGSKLVISGSLWIFFLKSEAEPQKKFNQKVFLWLRQEPFLTMIDETQPNSLSAIVFLNY